MKLSKQERIAAIVVVILLILVAGVFVFIKPNIETISSTKATLKAKEKEYNEDVAKVARKEELRKQILDAYDEGKNMADMFFPELASYEADNEFRAFLSQCKSNVLVEDFEVSAPTTAGLSTNIFIPEEVQYDLKNYVNQGTNVDITKIDPNLIRQTTIQLTLGAPQTIGATTVTFTVKATSYEELLKFADEVNNYQKDENGNKIRKAIEISEVRFNDLLTLSEYEEKSAEILDEAEQAAVAIFKEKTGKELSGSSSNNTNNNANSDEKNNQASLETYFYSMPCTMTFYSIERMQDPTEKLDQQDKAVTTGTATTGTANDGTTSQAASSTVSAS